MARITIESINEELKETGWKCVSENYQNLDTPLEFECDEGHNIHCSYLFWTYTFADGTPFGIKEE